MEKMMNYPDQDNYPPSFSASVGQISEMEDWEVGETYRMMIEVKMKSKNENEHQELNGSFDIVAYKDMSPEKDPMKMTDKEVEEMQGKAMSS